MGPEKNVLVVNKARKTKRRLETEGKLPVTLAHKIINATPQVPGLVRASSRNVREMNGSVSPAFHLVNVFFFTFSPPAYCINGMV